MDLTAFKEFKFSAAHCLEIEGHRCSNMHGHNYTVRIEVSGQADENGMIIDFDEIKKHANPLIAKIDHTNLNTTIGNSTSESICKWFHKRLKEKITGISKIEVRETASCGAVLKIKKV